MENNEFLDSKQAAKFLKVSVITLKSYVKRGLLPVHKSRSGKLYFTEDNLREFITR